MSSDKTPHTISSFDEDLHRIRTLVFQMGALAVAQITTAIEVVAEPDLSSALAVMASDAQIDALQVETEMMAVRIFSRHAPLAEDLREVMAALRISSALERVGDYAKSIAKRISVIAELPQAGPTGELAALGEAARQLLRRTMTAYLDRSSDIAIEVIRGDDAVDVEYNRTFRALVSEAETHPDLAEQIAHLQFVAKHFERVADQATNIAEQVQFADLGEMTTGRRPIESF
jgi:phosphate transport system protein